MNALTIHSDRAFVYPKLYGDFLTRSGGRKLKLAQETNGLSLPPLLLPSPISVFPARVAAADRKSGYMAGHFGLAAAFLGTQQARADFY